MDSGESYTLLIWLIMCKVLHAGYSNAECLLEVYSIVPGHTGCLEKSPHANESIAVTEEVKQEIVDQHNQYRASLNAANMQKMIWDDELAALAQKWTDNCDLKHDTGKRDIPGKYPTGQNLGLGLTTWSDLISAWNSEKRYFTYNDQEGTEFSKVGHFTQVVWAESARVGCSLTRCNNMHGNGLFYACNYAAQGNLRWWIPYNDTNEAGIKQVCSSCSDSCTEQGLCDCRGKVCENGGKLDVATCQCVCSKEYHTNDTCSIDCERAVDNRYCGRFWTEDQCFQYQNVPTECPVMCGICPLGDYRNRLETTPSQEVTIAKPAMTTLTIDPTTRKNVVISEAGETTQQMTINTDESETKDTESGMEATEQVAITSESETITSKPVTLTLNNEVASAVPVMTTTEIEITSRQTGKISLETAETSPEMIITTVESDVVHTESEARTSEQSVITPESEMTTVTSRMTAVRMRAATPVTTAESATYERDSTSIQERTSHELVDSRKDTTIRMDTSTLKMIVTDETAKQSTILTPDSVVTPSKVQVRSSTSQVHLSETSTPAVKGEDELPEQNVTTSKYNINRGDAEPAEIDTSLESSAPASQVTSLACIIIFGLLLYLVQ